MLDSGSWILDVLDPGCWILVSGFWIKPRIQYRVSVYISGIQDRNWRDIHTFEIFLTKLFLSFKLEQINKKHRFIL